MKTVVSATVNAAAATGKAVSNTHIATTSSATSIALKSEPSRETGGVAAMQAPNAANSAKRPISLDLNTAAPAKKQRLAGPSPLLLETPDFANKTLNTPDIEKILLSSNFLQTPDIFPPNVGAVTSEQEAFGKGFDEALHSLHTSKNSQTQMGAAGGNSTTNSNNVVNVTAAAPPAVAPAAVTSVAPTAGTGMSGGSFTYTNLETFPVAIKDEPQNAPASPPVSPIDMETQEKIKLERKRQRNRVAASKCRKRKLERISKLEDKVKMLKGENSDLAGVVKNLKDHVAQLKQQVINHMESGCDIQSIYNGAALLHVK